MERETECWRYEFQTKAGTHKTIRVVWGDLCDTAERYDVVICSAFQGDYLPVPRTLIGGLMKKRDIFVHGLAQEPELDLRNMGCWLSRELEGDFRRIACVELLNFRNRFDDRLSASTILKGAFSTMRFVLEQAAFRGISVRSVALPILGCGCQGISVSDVAGPLINQCAQALETVEGMECITFYERSSHKVAALKEVLERMKRANHPQASQVFISYSSHCLERAARLRRSLEKRGLRCWMAPDSIPAGSDYSREIPVALDQVQVLALLLTPEAELSNWVHKEVGIAIGNGRTVIPYQPAAYPLGRQFRFLLEGIQILRGWEYADESGGFEALAERVCTALAKG